MSKMTFCYYLAMRYFKKDNSYVLALSTGEELMDCLSRFASELEISSAWLSGLGAASVIEVGYYDMPGRTYHWKTFAGKLEITNLTGNLSLEAGKPLWHIHGSFSDESFNAIGGHIRKMVVGPNCELLVRKLGQPLIRVEDRASGLSLLDVEE